MSRHLDNDHNPHRIHALPKVVVLLVVALFALSACSEKQVDKKRKRRGASQHLVEVFKVTSKPIVYTTTRTGTIDVKRKVKLFTQEEGAIKHLTVYEGDQVTQGQLLVKIDDALLTAQLNKTIATREQFQQNLSRNRRLSKRRLVSEDALVKAQTSYKIARADENLLKTRVNNTSIKAPFTGIITERKAEPGDVVSKHTHILTLIDPSTYMIEVKITELLIPNYKVGDSVKIKIDALGTKQINGKIARIHPTVDSETRQGTLEIVMNPIPKGAKPGQLCRVILTSAPRPGLSIPFNALRRDKKGEFVFAVAKRQ